MVSIISAVIYWDEPTSHTSLLCSLSLAVFSVLDSQHLEANWTLSILLISDIQYLILPYTIYIYIHVYVWCEAEKGATEDEMVGWHHRLNGHELEQTWGDSEGQGSLAIVHGDENSQIGLSNWMTTTETTLPSGTAGGLCTSWLPQGDGQGSLTCCSPWGHKEPNRT